MLLTQNETSALLDTSNSHHTLWEWLIPWKFLFSHQTLWELPHLRVVQWLAIRHTPCWRRWVAQPQVLCTYPLQVQNEIFLFKGSNDKIHESCTKWNFLHTVLSWASLLQNFFNFFFFFFLTLQEEVAVKKLEWRIAPDCSFPMVYHFFICITGSLTKVTPII